MRCKVPAASRPLGLRATHAPPRRPEVTPAAHTDRMLQTPPDIATRSQSAGRGVNPPPPPGRQRPSWSAASLLPSLPGGRQLPPSWGQPLRWGPHPLPPQGASRTEGWASGVSFGLSAQQIGEVPAFVRGFLGSSCLFMEAEVLGAQALPLGVSRRQRVGSLPPQPVPTSTEQETACVPGSSQNSPGLHALGGARCPSCPWDWKAAWPGPAGQHGALELICCVTFG